MSYRFYSELNGFLNILDVDLISLNQPRTMIIARNNIALHLLGNTDGILFYWYIYLVHFDTIVGDVLYYKSA